ncbi:MAG TPA: Kdo hydroxylase family protein [Acidocella sp.]|nr:Kdo hydroxylase family protein [Acidocella sp.]
MLEQIGVTTLAEVDEALARHATLALEGGAVLLFPALPFALRPEEEALISAGQAAGAAKNVSYDPAKDALKGTSLEGAERDCLAGMMRRYGEFTEALVSAVLPAYAGGLTRARTSFRPVEIAGRVRSWRQDDTRRHVDAFPTSPVQGRRILRVFANVDQNGTPRRWRVGPDFEAYARDFWPLKQPLPGAASLRHLLGLTKTRRSRYDEAMLALHDAAKRDMGWQNSSPAKELSFLPGQVWMVYTDQVAHAVLSGRNALEQTFLVERDCMLLPERAPLAVLSRMAGRDMRRPLW